VVHSGVGGADLLAVGSVIQIARRKFAESARPEGKTHIWGSGLLHYTPRDFLKHVNVSLVRGPVTAALLGISTASFGDPGLLIGDALGQRPDRQDVIGIVPHHTQYNAETAGLLSEIDPAVRVIDPGGSAEDVCRQIGSCAHVYASSLHGLITADSFGVPSTWIDPGDQSHLKYHDYAASVGRAMINPLGWEEIPDHLSGLNDTADLPYADGIAQAQAALYTHFPASLRAPTKSGAA
ncbi:MAG: polysaccharide pyruvyl transferase family protein, partial [Paracoccaceae bacterium]